MQHMSIMYEIEVLPAKSGKKSMVYLCRDKYRKTIGYKGNSGILCFFSKKPRHFLDIEDEAKISAADQGVVGTIELVLNLTDRSVEVEYSDGTSFGLWTPVDGFKFFNPHPAFAADKQHIAEACSDLRSGGIFQKTDEEQVFGKSVLGR